METVPPVRELGFVGPLVGRRVVPLHGGCAFHLLGIAAHHEKRPVTEQRGRVALPLIDHARRRDPCPGRSRQRRVFGTRPRRWHLARRSGIRGGGRGRCCRHRAGRAGGGRARAIRAADALDVSAAPRLAVGEATVLTAAIPVEGSPVRTAKPSPVAIAANTTTLPAAMAVDRGWRRAWDCTRAHQPAGGAGSRGASSMCAPLVSPPRSVSDVATAPVSPAADPSTRPVRMANVAASVRLATPSLAMMFETWTPAVLSLMNRATPISRLVWPWATMASTSRSRAVSSRIGGVCSAVCGTSGLVPSRRLILAVKGLGTNSEGLLDRQLGTVRRAFISVPDDGERTGGRSVFYRAWGVRPMYIGHRLRSGCAGRRSYDTDP